MDRQTQSSQGVNLGRLLASEFGDWWGRLIFLYTLYALSFCTWIAFQWGSDEQRALLSDVSWVISGVLTFAFGWRASTHPSLDRRRRRAWRLVAAALFCYLGGNVIWGYYEVILRTEAVSSWADPVYFGYYPLMLAALLSFPMMKQTREERAKFWLDTGVVVVGSATLFWYFIIGPIAGGEHNTIADLLIALAYPVFDLVVLFGITALLLRRPDPGARLALSLFTLGVVIEAAADVIYAYVTLQGAYPSGGWPDIPFMLGPILMGLAAHVQYRLAGREAQGGEVIARRPRTFSLLPYLSIAALWALLVQATLTEWSMPLGGLIFATLLLTGLVVARQVVAVRESERTHRALSESERSKATLLNNLHGMAYRCLSDRDWTMLFISDGCEQLTGYVPEAFTGAQPISFNEMIHPEDRAHVHGIIAKALDERRRYELTYRIRTAVDEEKWVWEQGEGVHDERGNLMALEGFIHDITDRIRMEKELELARDAALESSRLKSQFLANMSHEIRTPMNGVIGMADLLSHTELSEEQRGYADTIRQSADVLLTIINDILDFSKIEAGKLHFANEDFDLRWAVEGAVEMLAERAEAKGLEIGVFIEPDVPLHLRGDAGRLRQVLTNLVGNAVKFTERGEVFVGVMKEGETDGEVRLRFEVRDTGIGIGESARHTLFQPFVQADGSTTRRYGGTGLGLAISKQLVEMMGGEIGVESEEGRGSTFHFTARFEKRPAVESQPAESESDASCLAGLRVLVVDDNATNRKILERQLASWGVVTSSIDGGAAALSALREDPDRDLVILDMMMPEMDGLELARAIKSDPALAPTRIMMMTSMGRRGEEEELREAGIEECLVKPVRQSHLLRCLVTLMSATRAGATEDTAREVLPQKTPRAANRLRVLLVEDNEMNQLVALQQLRKLGYEADTAGNGREALAALEAKGYDLVLMDCQMPELDGYEATAEIRRREAETGTHTIVVAMTANALQGDREACIAAGMDDYLPKPVKSADVEKMLAHWGSAGCATDSREGQLPSPHGTPSSPVIDEQTFESLSEMGGREFVEGLVALYERDTKARINALREGLARGDAHGVRELAHILKGASGNLGLRRVMNACAELETSAREGLLEGAPAFVEEIEREFASALAELAAEREPTCYASGA